jgi:hypothetical protein
MRNKKGALELSITAIVILIIAITILGLGIGFIKKQFGAGTELVGGELTRIREQMKDDIKASGELLVLNMPETSLSSGKPQNVLIGVKNTMSNPDKGRVCFWVEVKCLQPFNPDNTCSKGYSNIAIGGVDSENNFYPVREHNWFSSILSKFDIRNYDAEVFPATMLVRDAKPDQYSMEINLYRDLESRSCDDSSEPVLYASKSFTISVK